MIYLDNAATTYPKPPLVYDSVSKAVRRLGGNPSRGGHILSQRSADDVFSCRTELAHLFGSETENTAFTLNATYAINTAIKGVAKENDHFIISNLEHNAVLRPIVSVCERFGCQYDIADVLKQNRRDILSEIERLIRPNTRAVIMTHASNICSIRLPIREIGALCKKKGVTFIVDASQSAGHVSIDIKKDNINILCAPAHKGLYGCMGLGFLITDGKYDIQTLTEGGSGYNSADIHMPESMPEHLEAGTLPVVAISALKSGLAVIDRIGFDKIEKHERYMYSMLREMLSSLPFIKHYMPEHEGPCLLFNVIGVPSGVIDDKLCERDICIRSGFHCAPLAHSSLGTGEYGAIRCSFGIYTTENDIRAFVSNLADVISDIQRRRVVTD